MARGFASASSQKLTAGASSAQAVPLTMACWFKPTNTTHNGELMCITDTVANYDYFRLVYAGSAGGDPVIAWARQATGANGQATTSSGFSATWNHACAVFASNTSRSAYLNGASKGTNTVSVTVGATTAFVIGARHTAEVTQEYCDADIAEAAIWDVALTDAEVALLAKGYSPLLIRPQSVVHYWPLIGRVDPEIDQVGGLNLTLVNTPVVADHCRIIYPSASRFGYGPPAAGRSRLGDVVPFSGRNLWRPQRAFGR